MAAEYTSLLSLLVSIVAVVVAATSLVRSRKLAQKQLELQVKQQELASAQLQLARAEASEREKALIVISLEPYKNVHRFYIRNRGRATARNVDFVVQPAEGKNSPLADDYKDVIPVPEMPQGHEVSVLAALSGGTGIRFDCKCHGTIPTVPTRSGMALLRPR